MSERLVIDCARFAQSGEELNSVIPIAELSRLVGLLWTTDGTLAFSLHGTQVTNGQAGLQLDLNGTLHLACQRCLGEISFPLTHTRKFCVTGNGPDNVADEDPDVDFLPLIGKLDIWELIEEETLLCLPLAPTHEASTCGPRLGAQDQVERVSPFSGLRRP